MNFCSRETQLRWFEKQLELSKRSRLPLFLHMRAACADLLAILRANPDSFTTGVVHSFDGTEQEAQEVLGIPGLRIGGEVDMALLAKCGLHLALWAGRESGREQKCSMSAL